MKEQYNGVRLIAAGMLDLDEYMFEIDGNDVLKALKKALLNVGIRNHGPAMITVTIESLSIPIRLAKVDLAEKCLDIVLDECPVPEEGKE